MEQFTASEISFGNSVLPDVLIFRTSIDSKESVERVFPLLAVETRIARWSVDIHDVDNVLRVESNDLSHSDIIELITRAGFHCEELPD